MKFAVSVIQPPEYQHSRSVWEVAETVHFGLLRLGYDSVLTFDTNLSDRQHITLLPNLLVSYRGELSPNTILYNLDQVYPESPWLQPVVLDYLLQYPVWDYSKANIEQLRQMGIAPVQHVPIGYVPELSRIPAMPEEIDVLFYGSVNQRRHQILEALSDRGVRVEAIFGVYGQERDDYIARSKIVLNMHFYPAKVFEIVRVSYLLANQRFVISEPGCDPAETVAFKSGIAFAGYDQLVETCIDFLQRPDARNQIAATGFDLIRQRPETDYLSAALKNISVSKQTADTFVFEKDLYRKKQAASALDSRQFEDAIALYEQSLEADPDCTLSYWNLGLALLLQGDEMAAQFCWLTGISQAEPAQAEARTLELLQVLQQTLNQQIEVQNSTWAACIQQQILALNSELK